MHSKVPLLDRFELGQNALEQWSLFKLRWANYIQLAEINAEQQAAKLKALFLCCLSDNALRVYNSFNLADDSTVEHIIARFEQFIVGETNVTYERFVFNKRKQEEN